MWKFAVFGFMGACLLTNLAEAGEREDARYAAESFLMACMRNDITLYSKVSPYKTIDPVFNWEFIGDSEVKIEKGEIYPIKSALTKWRSLKDDCSKTEGPPAMNWGFVSPYRGLADGKSPADMNCLRLFGERLNIAESVKPTYPQFGEFLGCTYSTYLIPGTLTDSRDFTLKTYTFTAGVELQGRGSMLNKTITFEVYDFLMEGYDSKWQVLYAYDPVALRQFLEGLVGRD